MYEGNQKPLPKPAPPSIVKGPFRASYDGQCSGCDFPIEIGQRIAQMTTGGYVHWECAQ
jgi:hypothetical protein